MFIVNLVKVKEKYLAKFAKYVTYFSSKIDPLITNQLVRRLRRGGVW